jgi:hypothetical protein
MPSTKIVAPTNVMIFRFRCYACGDPWWGEIPDPAEAIREGSNTMIALCDPCGNRFTIEGPFWRNNGKELQETEK